MSLKLSLKLFSFPQDTTKITQNQFRKQNPIMGRINSIPIGEELRQSNERVVGRVDCGSLWIGPLVGCRYGYGYVVR